MKSVLNKMVIYFAGSLCVVKKPAKWKTLGRQLCCHAAYQCVQGGSNVPPSKCSLRERWPPRSLIKCQLNRENWSTILILSNITILEH